MSKLKISFFGVNFNIILILRARLSRWQTKKNTKSTSHTSRFTRSHWFNYSINIIKNMIRSDTKCTNAILEDTKKASTSLNSNYMRCFGEIHISFNPFQWNGSIKKVRKSNSEYRLTEPLTHWKLSISLQLANVKIQGWALKHKLCIKQTRARDCFTRCFCHICG